MASDTRPACTLASWWHRGTCVVSVLQETLAWGGSMVARGQTANTWCRQDLNVLDFKSDP